MHIRKPDEILSQKYVLFMRECLFENLVSFDLTLTRLGQMSGRMTSKDQVTVNLDIYEQNHTENMCGNA